MIIVGAFSGTPDEIREVTGGVTRSELVLMVVQWFFAFERRTRLVGDDCSEYFRNNRDEGNPATVIRFRNVTALREGKTTEYFQLIGDSNVRQTMVSLRAGHAMQSGVASCYPV